MKELTIEQKAKAYDEVIERAKGLIDFCSDSELKTLEYVFPELKEESEDERIKEWLINLAKGHIEWLEDRIGEQLSNGQVYGGELVKAKNSLAWLERQKTSEEAMQYLRENHSSSEVNDFQAAMNIAVAKAYDKGYNDALEKQGEQKPYGQRQECVDCQFNYAGECKGSCGMKQGEQKPADKVEPKFNVGDWLVHKDLVGVTCCITQIHAPHYYSTNNNSFIKFGEEGNYRPWTIQDAKEGDALATKAGGIFIYKELLYDKPFAYCGVDKFGVFKDCNCGKGSDWTPYLNDVTPATKEQRDLLFQKMKEAGYEWDVKKKELKKIEQNPIKVSKQEWNEETSMMIDNILGTYKTLEDMLDLTTSQDRDILESMNFERDWIKSLKYRIQPKQEWSEEDDYNIQCLAAKVVSDIQKGNVGRNQELIAWLKSLKDRYTWKPSDEQMEFVWKYAEQNNYDGKVFTRLYNDLKKLKGK